MQRHHLVSTDTKPNRAEARSLAVPTRSELRGLVTAALAALVLTGCSPWFWGGAAVGAVGAGAAYERENRQELDRLERAFKRGEISKQEYLERKKEIEDRSVVR